MNSRATPLEHLKNIGPTIANRLRTVGICTRQELKRVGPVAAYRRIASRFAEQTIPVCYYLYSLEGALTGKHWNDLEPARKRALATQARAKRT